MPRSIVTWAEATAERQQSGPDGVTEAFTSLYLRDPRGSPEGLAWLVEQSDKKLDENTALLQAYEHSRAEWPSPTKRTLAKLKPVELESIAARHAYNLGITYGIISEHREQWQRLSGFPKNARPVDEVLFALNTIYAADPSATSSERDKPTYGANIPHLLRWMLNVSGDGMLLPENLPAARADLTQLAKHKDALNAAREKGSLPVDDLSQYTTIYALRDALPEEKVSIEERQRFEAKAIKAGAELLGQGPDWVVMRLATQESAINAGEKTPWCTAIKNPRENHFETYKNNLIYFRVGHDVFQLNLEKNEFKDAKDKAIEGGLTKVLAMRPEAGPTLVRALSGWREGSGEPMSKVFLAGHKKAPVLNIGFLAAALTVQDAAFRSTVQQAGLAALEVVTTPETASSASISDIIYLIGITQDQKLIETANTKVKQVMPALMARIGGEGYPHRILSLLSAAQKTKNAELLALGEVAAVQHLPPAINQAMQQGIASGFADKLFQTISITERLGMPKVSRAVVEALENPATESLKRVIDANLSVQIAIESFRRQL